MKPFPHCSNAFPNSIINEVKISSIWSTWTIVIWGFCVEPFRTKPHINSIAFSISPSQALTHWDVVRLIPPYFGIQLLLGSLQQDRTCAMWDLQAKPMALRISTRRQKSPLIVRCKITWGSRGRELEKEWQGVGSPIYHNEPKINPRTKKFVHHIQILILNQCSLPNIHLLLFKRSWVQVPRRYFLSFISLNFSSWKYQNLKNRITKCIDL